MKIAIASDKSGFELKEAIRQYLEDCGYDYVDFGTHSAEEKAPYYEAAPLVAKEVGSRKADFGILVCGTGMGMSQVANKFPGVIAACCEGVFSTMMSRAINNSNVLCMGGWMLGAFQAERMVKAFLETEHTQGLETWRQEFLKNAYIKVCEIDQKTRVCKE